MTTNIVVPALGESVVEATVGKWLKHEGDAVTAGEPLVELETDKVNLAVPAEKAGVLSHIARKEGEDVKVGDVLGTLGETGRGHPAPDESKPATARSNTAPQPAAAPKTDGASGVDAAAMKEKAAPKSQGAAGIDTAHMNEKAVPKSDGAAGMEAAPMNEKAAPKSQGAAGVEAAAMKERAAPNKEGTATDAAPMNEKAAPKSDGAAMDAAAAKAQDAPKSDGAAMDAIHKATSLAQRIAAAQGVDVGQLEGSGPGGRVTKDDVQQFLTQRTERPAAGSEPVGAASADTQQAVAPVKSEPAKGTHTRIAGQLEPAATRATATPAAGGDGRREERQRMSRRRQTIARRLVEAQHTAAMLTTFNEVDMSAIIDIRKRRKESFAQQHGIKLGFVSFFVKASIGALKGFPRLNAEIQDADFVLKKYYDIGMAIGAEEGLVVPVLRDADRMSFAEIERAIDGYVQKTRDGSLSIEDLRGGTFTITNGGVFGSLLSTPILNPPQVGILGLHKIQERPIALNGQVVIRPMMYLALSYDHRIVDGREAVQFLVRLKELVEDPESLLLEG